VATFPFPAGTIDFVVVASSKPHMHDCADMDRFASTSSDGADASGNARFTSQAATAEDLLKAQTVGLVNLDDYRKRRAEALDRRERGDTATSSGENTPTDGYACSQTIIQRPLICKVQGIDADTRFQKEAQSSRQSEAVVRYRRRR
jgi:hypothetical protein